jgi:hypothetical protein
MLPRSADLVVERMRHSCLDGVRLVSDRQPTRLRVDEHTPGPPAPQMPLSLRPTRLSSLVYADQLDYTVFEDGRAVGR